MDKKIKLNLPCWICNKELFLGEGLVTYPVESNKSPAHLSCMKTQALAEVIKIIDEMERLSNINGENGSYKELKVRLQEIKA